MFPISIFIFLYNVGHTKIHIQNPFTLKEMISKSKSFGMKKQEVLNCVKFGIFDPTNMNSKIIDIGPFSRLELTNWQNYNFQSNQLTLKKLLENFYCLFPDEIAIKSNQNIPKSKNYKKIISQLKNGKLIFQCGGISILASSIIRNEKKLNNFYCDYALLKKPNHTLNTIIYIENGVFFYLVIDFQNGFFFPYNSKTKSIMSYTELVNQKTIDFSNIYWLSDSILYSKRTFLNKPLPANFLVQKKEKYIFAPSNSPFKLIRLAKSFHAYLWFEKGFVNKREFAKNLGFCIKDYYSKTKFKRFLIKLIAKNS